MFSNRLEETRKRIELACSFGIIREFNGTGLWRPVGQVDIDSYTDALVNLIKSWSVTDVREVLLKSLKPNVSYVSLLETLVYFYKGLGLDLTRENIADRLGLVSSTKYTSGIEQPNFEEIKGQIARIFYQYDRFNMSAYLAYIFAIVWKWKSDVNTIMSEHINGRDHYPVFPRFDMIDSDYCRRTIEDYSLEKLEIGDVTKLTIANHLIGNTQKLVKLHAELAKCSLVERYDAYIKASKVLWEICSDYDPEDQKLLKLLLKYVSGGSLCCRMEQLLGVFSGNEYINGGYSLRDVPWLIRVYPYLVREYL